MKRRLVLAGVVLVALTGCAVPTWVPFLGKSGGKDKGARAARSVTPGVEEIQAPVVGETVVKPPSATAQDEHVADRVVAVVNNDAITLGELQENIAVFRQENRTATSTTDEELAKQFLGRLIDTRLQLQEAEREKIVVEESELNEELTDRMKKFNAKTPEELEAIVRAQGITMEAVKKRLKESLRVAKVIRRKVGLRVSVTDSEITQYIEANRGKLETGLTYHARHLLIVPDVNSDAGWEAARIRADLLREEILGGADFAELAQKYSSDASARDGGDLGTLRRGELTQDIEEQILRLVPREVSRPYRSRLGYHVFRLESMEALEGEGLQRVRQQVREILYREKYEARRDAWLKEIKQRAIIEVRM